MQVRPSMRRVRADAERPHPRLVWLALLLLAACGSAVGQGAEYDPPNDLPLGEPTDRSDEDAGRGRDAGLDAADARD